MEAPSKTKNEANKETKNNRRVQARPLDYDRREEQPTPQSTHDGKAQKQLRKSRRERERDQLSGGAPSHDETRRRTLC